MSSIFSCKVAALDLIYSISVSNPFLNLVMQLKCLYPVHSVSALIKFHTSISKSVTVHNFGFVQGQTLQVWIPCIWPLYICGMYGDRHYRFRYHVYDHCIFVVCTGTDITGIDTMYMTVVYLWYVRGQTLQVRYHAYDRCLFVVCTGTDITG